MKFSHGQFSFSPSGALCPHWQLSMPSRLWAADCRHMMASLTSLGQLWRGLLSGPRFFFGAATPDPSIVSLAGVVGPGATHEAAAGIGGGKRSSRWFSMSTSSADLAGSAFGSTS
jgi:hypothetical protein